MSTVTQRPSGELPRANPVFSYAQAAKGRSPSGPPSVSTEKTCKADQNIGPANDLVTQNPDSTYGTGNSFSKRAASEGGHSRSSSTKAFAEMEPSIQVNSGSVTTPATATATPATQTSGQSQVTVSTPSSPEFGVTSASTLPKDDDLFSNANASSDSTWEKLSQSSQNGSRANDKNDNEKEPITNGSNDEETPASPALPTLKEAPPPAVNFWQQRIEAQAAKQPSKTSNTNPPSQGRNIINTNNAAKPFDIGVESRKYDSKKQAKRGHCSLDEKPATTGIKDGTKSGDGKGKGEVSEVGSQRVARPLHADRFTTESMPPPPPPNDAQSWPTPDSAQDEEKKKTQERADKGEKEKSGVAKAHGKEKWMPVPYVPSVQWSTPIPTLRRGARAPRGGRDGGPRVNPLGADKPRAEMPDLSTGSHLVTDDHGKADLVAPRNHATNSGPKRASSTGPPLRDQRRGGNPTASEKRNESGIPTSQVNDQHNAPAADARRAFPTTQDEILQGRRSTADFDGAESYLGGMKGLPSSVTRHNPNNTASDSHAHPRSVGVDRRGEAGIKSYNHARDVHHPAPARERGEGRPDRGRGGYRARGNSNHGFGHTNIPNGHVIHQQSYGPPSMASKAYSNHERHVSQLPNSNHTQPQNHGRSFRSGSGSYLPTHSMTNARFPQGPHSNQLPSLQTDIANAWGFQPSNQGVMSANPYNPYMEHVSIFGMVSMQMEYYFSVDNLCKDVYLRKHMDSQGFVFLSVLAKFNRIRQLTQDLDLIRYVCLQSPHIEFRTASDGCDRLRKREGWQQWVLAVEERDPSAQNDGPGQVQQPLIQQQPFYDAPHNLDDRQITSPPFTGTYNHHHSDANVLSPMPISPSRTVVNGDMNGAVTSPSIFAAAGPAFALGPPPLKNQEAASTNEYRPAENTFTDEQVDLLMIVVRKSLNNSTQTSPPFHSATSRTFSNGSIDGRTINDELAKFSRGEKLVDANGDGLSDVAETQKPQRSRSPFTLGSPLRRPNHIVSPPVFWVKDQETPIDCLPDDLTHEPYNTFRRNALMQRERASGGVCHYDMDILYQFWSHFLIRNFNARMYQEFCVTAFEDADKYHLSVGLKHLIQFYNESILGQKVVSDQIARDFLDLVMGECTKKERPAFYKLRAAWRNGAFNMKNRKKLDSMIDTSLKAELEH